MAAFFNRSAVFNPNTDIPSLAGKVIIVTGGNIGLGAESVLQFAKHEPEAIFLAARNKVKADATIEWVRGQVPGARVEFLELDLSSLDSVRKAAEEFARKAGRLDVLMNNAGVMACPEGLTSDGYEMHFGINHIGHALLTKLLMPILRKTAAEPGSDVRIVNLSSGSMKHAPDQGLLLDQCKTTLPNLSRWTRYSHSKLANVLFTIELARRFPSITSTTLHPGIVGTNIGHDLFEESSWLGAVFAALKGWIASSAATGALTQLWCATSKDAQSGAFYWPVARKVVGLRFADDERLAGELWNWTEAEFEEKGFGGEW